MAQKFADTYDMPLFETSAIDDSEADHVDAIFMTLAHKLKNCKPMMPSSLSPSYASYSSTSGPLRLTRKDLEVTAEENSCCMC
ncbi:ras-related protein Rab-33B [Caerostris darwini]|uniref:Ras-related protein Rab-33B n=1 Tax=Caerostris darwini TaxID=1538125 RepID=A0AAV4PMD4_9ARAC|nr:ras-related protein Rab-33B [Caerostris darwini]